MRNQAFIFSILLCLNLRLEVISFIIHYTCRISSALLQIKLKYHAYRTLAYNHHTAAETASKFSYCISINAKMIIRRYNVI